MSITRAAAAAYLRSQFSNLATEIGQTTHDDTSLGYGADIDAALRRLGVAESDLATAEADDADRIEYYALCDYFCLQRMARQLTTRVDSGALVQEGDRQRVYDNVRALLAEATAVIERMGYGPETFGQAGAGLWGAVDFNLDYIEPSSGSEYT